MKIILLLIWIPILSFSQNKEEGVRKIETAVIDYHFYKNKLISLRKKEHYYFTVNNKVLKNTKFPLNTVLAFKKDALGEIYIMNEDSICQLLISDTIISFYKKEFRWIIPNTLDYKAFSDSLIISVLPPQKNRIKFHHQAILYFFDKYNENGVLYEYTDRTQQEKATNIYNKIIGIYNKTTPEQENVIVQGKWDNRIEHLKISNDEMRFWVLYYNNLAKPVYVPFLDFKNRFYILNYSNDSIYQFNKDAKPVRQIFFPFTKIPNLMHKIIFDEKLQKVYILKEKNGHAFLQAIDLNKGCLLEEKEIPIRFPKNIKVNDGNIYFIDTSNNLLNVKQ